MKYIISSIGRSGSTLVWKLIGESLNKKCIVVDKFDDIKGAPNAVIKTHDHFRYEPDYPYRAVFMYDRIEKSIVSLYNKNNHFIELHLIHLRVSIWHRAVFLVFSHIKVFREFFRQSLFAYLIKGDKFRFRQNIKTWQKAKNILFVDFADLCADKERCLKQIGDFIGAPIKDFQVRERTSDVEELPQQIKELIAQNYGDEIYPKRE